MASKERLDVLLVERGFYESREKAKSAIMAGLVFVRKERVDKPGTKIDLDSQIEVQGALHPYVSRGGLKLEKAIQVFDLNLNGAIVLDIGASTGGFTDCALQHGAAHVYSVDVGYGQLAWTLRQDERVTVMERTNFRYLIPEDLKGPVPTFATIDVSFISLRIILPALYPLLGLDGQVVALIKPQFEAGKDKVGKNGIVRDPDIHLEVIRRVIGFAKNERFALKGLSFSPITGGEGNIEFLAVLEKKDLPIPDEIDEALIQSVVQKAHEKLTT